jgi:hypothetical protein
MYENGTKLELTEIEFENANWIYLTQFSSELLRTQQWTTECYKRREILDLLSDNWRLKKDWLMELVTRWRNDYKCWNEKECVGESIMVC